MSTTPAKPSHTDRLSVFQEVTFMDGLSEDGIHQLLAFASDLVRENKHLRSQIDTDDAYRTELEVEKFALQLEIHEMKAENV